MCHPGLSELRIAEYRTYRVLIEELELDLE